MTSAGPKLQTNIPDCQSHGLLTAPFNSQLNYHLELYIVLVSFLLLFFKTFFFFFKVIRKGFAFLAVWLSNPRAPYFQSTVVKCHIRVLI